MTREELIEKVKEVAARLRMTALTQKEFYLETGISDYWTIKYFHCWTRLCLAAGISPKQAYGLSDNEVLAAMRDAFDRQGGIGTVTQFESHFSYTLAVLRSRWSGWLGALRALHDWALVHDPGFPYLAQLEERIAQGTMPGRRAGRDIVAPAPILSAEADDAVSEPARDAHRDHPVVHSDAHPGNPDAHPDAPADPRSEGPSEATQPAIPAMPDLAPMVGEVIAYRGIVYAPTNEMGVVMLFAVAAEALGFAIESSRTAFPDCVAWQRVGPGRYRRVRIEIEYASSNFRAHRHDPKGCELVVCWEHDWPACPVKVLDLKKEIARLRSG